MTSFSPLCYNVKEHETRFNKITKGKGDKMKSKIDPDRLYTPGDAAIASSRSYRTIMNHVHGLTLKATKRPGSRLYDILGADLIAWIEGEPVGEQKQAGGSRA